MRDVSIVVHLANGQDVVYGSSDKVLFNPNPEPEVEAMEEAVEAIIEEEGEPGE